MSQNLPDNGSVPVVDCTCDCEECVSRTTKTYRMNAVCSNCSGEYITEHRFGDGTSSSVECPHCGVTYRAIFKGRVA